MNEIPSAAVPASVISLLVREFSHQTVAEQAKLKAQLAALLAVAIGPLRNAARVVLDAPDGMVAVVLDEPARALEVAQRAQSAAEGLPLCIGVNHGPVKLAADAGGVPELLGDGIVAAVTLAKLATRGRLLASRSFHDALEATAPHRATEISSIGAFTDANVRTHDLFTLDPRAAAARRRWLLAAGALAVCGILAAGAGVRLVRSGAKRPAVIQLEITPLGDIFVDGEKKGRSPPLTRLEVSPGPHTIEVRNPAHPPLKLALNLKPAEEMSVTHTFAAPKKADRARKEKKEESFIDGVRRKLGI